jgi:hypothetical protein
MNFWMRVDTPHPTGPITTALTLTGTGPIRPGDPRLDIDDKDPVLMYN